MHSRGFAPLGAIAFAVLAHRPAAAQIRQPGVHPRYAAEFEPHFVLQWDDRPWGKDGVGAGARFVIPVIDNGPVRTINNNLGIGFGLDWVHFSSTGCGRWWWPGWYKSYAWWNGADCSANFFWAPVVAQWNFFLTPAISVFGEGGLAIVHERYSFRYPCTYPTDPARCDETATDTSVQPVVQGGARFLASESFGVVVRVGTPYLSIGPTFLF